MPTIRTPRRSWIDEGLRALAAGGPDAVRVESLAKKLGVTKGGFYWHFEDRGALLEEMLDAWERAAIDAVIEEIDEAGGDGRVRLRRLSEIAIASEHVLDVDLAVRDWARRDRKVGRRLRRADDRRMDYMRAIFREFGLTEDEVEVRAFLAFSLWIGNHFIAAEHGDLTRADVLAASMGHLQA